MKTAQRRGITLLEILISILIFGVGVTSVLTLFPLGLLNVRAANRYSRSGFLVESATADVNARNLFSKASFMSTTTSPWNTATTFTPIPYDPWTQDTPRASLLGPVEDNKVGPYGAYRGEGCFKANGLTAPYELYVSTGLPVAYDPLWRDTTGRYFDGTTEDRFASGIGFVRPDPQGGNPSAHGLQRITNFPAGSATSVPDIFVSPEDMVLQSDKDKTRGAGSLSPIVPDMSFPVNAITKMLSPQYDWKYTWMFTGQQADTANGSVLIGDIVVFENRPFAVDPVAAPFTVTPKVTTAVAGEQVVEAIFGYTSKVTADTAASAVGYGVNAKNVVLLRWPASMPDPEIRVGNWIADVTYERDAATSNLRAIVHPSAPPLANAVGPAGRFFHYQRCEWYQIAKRTQVGPGKAFTGDNGVAFREMTVWTASDLRAFTLLSTDGTGSPYHVNAALVSPYVVNVFPRTFQVY